jgi:hypothetical protein
LPFALSVMPAFSVLAAGLFLLASRTYLADLDAIEAAPAAGDGELQPQAA